MERRFDLRLAHDREDLASYLPAFDARTFNLTPEAFVQGLAFVAEYLGAPEWLTYQWGILGPLRASKRHLHIDLERIVMLGHELHSISSSRGFSSFVRNFSNATQFHDSLFEAEVASMFARLNATSTIDLAPEHRVRGHLKRPEFDADTSIGPLSVECKQRNPSSHNIAERVRTISNAVAEAMDAASWPDNLRLEVEILSPLRKQPRAFAKELVQLAQLTTVDSAFELPSARAFVVKRESPFRIEQMQMGQDRMNAPHCVSTHLLNPAVTSLRVAFNGAENKMVSAVGAQIVEAIHQLPSHRLGLIFLGGVPARIALQAVDKRLNLCEYDDVLAFGVVEQSEIHFVFRECRRSMLEALFNRGQRPLVGTPPN